MAELHTTTVDLRGLMRVLGEALYSTPHVAVRELVQNAHDSIHRRRLESGGGGGLIRVEVDTASRTLRIHDDGSGLTEDEVHRYLATVGRGYTRTLRDDGRGDGLIGYFGMGFLSAFAVAESVTVETRSVTPGHAAVRFQSHRGDTYTIETASRVEAGSTVTLKLRGEFDELLDPVFLRRLLVKYCCLLHHRIELGGEPINAEPPPFRLPADISPIEFKRRGVAFVENLEGSEPLAVIRLGSDQSWPRGLFYIRGDASYATSDLRRVAAYVRGMLIGDKDRDLLPTWAGFVGLVVEDDALTPTASRETLKVDAEYLRVQTDIRTGLLTGLRELARREPATWRRILRRHNEQLLGAALADDLLFELLADDVTVPTSEGDLTLPALARRSPDGIHVSDADSGTQEELIFRARHVPVVRGRRFGAGAMARRYASKNGVALVEVGTNEGNRRLFRPVEIPTAEDERLVALFGDGDRAIVPCRFEPAHLPFIAVRDRDAELRALIDSDEADRRMGGAVLALARVAARAITARPVSTLFVNMDNPAIRAGIDADAAGQMRARGLLAPLVVLLDSEGPGAEVDAAFATLTAMIATSIEGAA